MSERLGKIHFWPSLICMNLLFGPMFLQGIAGFHRRWYDGGKSFEETASATHWLCDAWSWFANHIFGMHVPANMLGLNSLMSFGAWGLALAQVPFILNFFFSISRGKKVSSDNPWHATTLEWATPTPPGHGNFNFEPVVYRDPYEYSQPGAPTDYTPQWLPPGEKPVEQLTHAQH
jgi:cytochrome c oxidase subunit 1